MSKRVNGNEAKNSSRKPVEKTIRLTDESTVILKIKEQGAFGAHGGNKQILPKQKKYSRKRSAYVEPTYHTCIKKIHLNAEAVKYYTSVDSCPLHGKTGMAEWQAKSPLMRLIANLAITAEDKEFEFEIVD